MWLLFYVGIKTSVVLPWLKRSIELFAGGRVRPPSLCAAVPGVWQAHIWDRLNMRCTGCQSYLCLLWMFTSFSRLTGGSITAEGMTDLVQALSQCLQLEEIKWVCCGNDPQINCSFLGAWGANKNESVCSLQDNRIRDPDVKRVMDLFSRMEKLKKIEWVKMAHIY